MKIAFSSNLQHAQSQNFLPIKLNHSGLLGETKTNVFHIIFHDITLKSKFESWLSTIIKNLQGTRSWFGSFDGIPWYHFWTLIVFFTCNGKKFFTLIKDISFHQEDLCFHAAEVFNSIKVWTWLLCENSLILIQYNTHHEREKVRHCRVYCLRYRGSLIWNNLAH